MAVDSSGVNVIVVGGGLSGLVAAAALRQRDPSLQLLVLEAGPRIGGRAKGAWHIRQGQLGRSF